MKLVRPKEIHHLSTRQFRSAVKKVYSVGKAYEDNFFISSVADWNMVDKSSIAFRVDHASNSGSEYMYTAEGCYRRSDHWGYRIASCIWTIEGGSIYEQDYRPIIGFCRWADFRRYSIETDNSSLRLPVVNYLFGQKSITDLNHLLKSSYEQTKERYSAWLLEHAQHHNESWKSKPSPGGWVDTLPQKQEASNHRTVINNGIGYLRSQIAKYPELRQYAATKEANAIWRGIRRDYLKNRLPPSERIAKSMASAKQLLARVSVL